MRNIIIILMMVIFYGCGDNSTSKVETIPVDVDAPYFVTDIPDTQDDKVNNLKPYRNISNYKDTIDIYIGPGYLNDSNYYHNYWIEFLDGSVKCLDIVNVNYSPFEWMDSVENLTDNLPCDAENKMGGEVWYAEKFNEGMKIVLKNGKEIFFE